MDKTATVFQLECPSVGGSGIDNWLEELEEFLVGDLDLWLSKNRDDDGFPESSKINWNEQLMPGSFQYWVTEIIDVTLEDSQGEAWAPMRELFLEMGKRILNEDGYADLMLD